MVQPTKLFWNETKHVLRYLKGTSQYGLWYRWIEGVKLQGFTEADWAGSPSNQKSTSGGNNVNFETGTDIVTRFVEIAKK